MTKKTSKTRSLKVTFHPHDFKRVQAFAIVKRLPVATFIREILLNELDRRDAAAQKGN